MKKTTKGTTEATTYDLYASDSHLYTIESAGLQGAEVIEIEELSGQDWVPLSPSKQLTSSNPVTTLQAPFEYRINKPVTQHTTAVYINYK